MLNKEELIGGRYRIKSLIGDGGMANVYLAYDEILQREVAVKVLRYQLASDAVFVRRFEREAQSVTALSHPNIVNVYDVGSEGDTHYIVMEYVTGNTVKQLIQARGYLTVIEAVEIMQQILAAVEQAHDFGIVHRDLKPQNIIVRPDGIVKVMDFGIALTQEATSLTQTHSVMGSVQYLSPEQVRGETATNQSDLYELGIVLYEMLTGELPFDGESAVNIVLKHLKDELPDIQVKNAEVPNSLVNIINRATAKEKSNRYPNAQEMRQDLQSSLNPERLNEPIVPIDVWVDTAVNAMAQELEVTQEVPVLVRKKVDITQSTEAVAQEAVQKIANAQVQPESGVSKKKKKKPWLLPTIIVAIILALVTGGLVYANYQQNRKIEIPNVSNLTLSQAQETLTELGLLVSQKVNYEYSDTIDKGKVISSDPKAGTSVERNTSVTLTVSEGMEVYMPYIVGKTKADALAALDKLKIRNQTVEEYSDQPEGVVLTQSIAEGSFVDTVSDVALLTISKGPAPIYMEDFTGFTKEAVERFANENGLELEIVEEGSSSAVGTVLKQFPASGSKLNVGDKISITIAKKQSIFDSLFPSTPESDTNTSTDTTTPPEDTTPSTETPTTTPEDTSGTQTGN
ncbi:MAG: Stk1 family PASTA domain-containing Ser/Thr kinase [Culicoidibacterales bacterium]